MFEIRDITKIKINDRLIGDGEPCFIIAEVGCGHDGSYENAKNMVDMAVEAKCDAVKFQTFEANKLFNEFTQEHVVEKLKKWEFKREWHKPLKDYAESKGLIFLSSAFSEEDIDFLEQLFIPAHKVASYEMTDKHLVECIAKKQKPVLMSCGIATIEEIEKSVEWIYQQGNKQLALFHCVSAYPTVYEDLNLKTIPFLKEKFKVPVGLSSHCNSVIDAIAAVVLGANMIEKHITYDKSLEHGDHKFALNAEELKQMVTSIRNVEKSIGKAKNGPSEGEKIETQWRRSIYAKVDIDVGEKLSEDNLMIVRPSPLGSLAPEYYEKVLGQQIKTSVKKGELITREMVDI